MSLYLGIWLLFALDERTLLSHGFEFDPVRRGMCSISGARTPCEVEAFVWGESSKDPLAYTCAKLNKATYTGNCVEGKLEGVALIVADGTGKISKEAFVAYFSRGRLAYPALTSYLSGSSKRLNLGTRELRKSYGCVYFGDWDRSREREGCKRLRAIFGDDVFSEANAQALKNGSFDLEKYQARFTASVAQPESPHVQRVQAYRSARERNDIAAERTFLSPHARMWYEKREGEGEPLTAGRSGRYAHWDEFFHSRATFSDWTADGNSVSALVHETNDFYQLLDWTPKPYRMTWWLDERGLITGAMVQSQPGKATSRLPEFQEWARANHPAELEYLMPKGRIDPTGDRPERFKALLLKWRALNPVATPHSDRDASRGAAAATTR